MAREVSTTMKLVTAIVNDEDAAKVLKALSDHEIGAPKIASTGGFLRRGSALILAGVDARRLDEAIDLIRSNCGRRHRVDTSRLAHLPTGAHATTVEAGGAVVMVSDVEKYLRV